MFLLLKDTSSLCFIAGLKLGLENFPLGKFIWVRVDYSPEHFSSSGTQVPMGMRKCIMLSKGFEICFLELQILICHVGLLWL